MLSDVDFRRELGRGICIYPFDGESIRGASINVRASQWACSVREMSMLSTVPGDGESGSGVLQIAPGDTVLIWTQETVALDNRLAGLCHSMVRRAALGLSHIGTTVDPRWAGRFLVPVTNHSDTAVSLAVGEPFATVTFHYLRSRADKVPMHHDGARLAALPERMHVPQHVREELQRDGHGQRAVIRSKMLDSESYRLYRRQWGPLRMRARALLWTYTAVPITIALLGALLWTVDQFVVSNLMGFFWQSLLPALVSYGVFVVSRWGEWRR